MTMPHLSYTGFDGLLHTHELKTGTTRIGRTPDNDLQIDELAVSSHHCEIRYADGKILVRDLDSTTGTYVEGEPVTEREINIGEVLGLGALLVHVGESGSQTSVPPAFTSWPLGDGSYSCLRHHSRRALFQCPVCFNLACEECVRPGEPTSKEVFCRSCGAKCELVDWSGLTMGKKEAAIRLLPECVQKALELWGKRRR